jgi:hypothetical protein
MPVGKLSVILLLHLESKRTVLHTWCSFVGVNHSRSDGHEKNTSGTVNRIVFSNEDV